MRMVLNAKCWKVFLNTDSEPETEADLEEDADEDLLEPWPAFLQRVAQWTDDQLTNAKLAQWTVQWRKKKWRWNTERGGRDFGEVSTISFINEAFKF